MRRKRINTKKKRWRKFAKRRQNYGSRPCVVHFYSTVDCFFLSHRFFKEGKFYASRHALSPLLLLLLFFLSCFPRCILQNIDFRRLAFRSGSPRLAPERGDKPEKRIAPRVNQDLAPPKACIFVALSYVLQERLLYTFKNTLLSNSLLIFFSTCDNNSRERSINTILIPRRNGKVSAL